MWRSGGYVKVFSELAPLETAEFMANDEVEYKLWTQAFDQVVKACEYLEENATLEATLK
jgi:cobalamin biosynthesis protein CobT